MNGREAISLEWEFLQHDSSILKLNVNLNDRTGTFYLELITDNEEHPHRDEKIVDLKGPDGWRSLGEAARKRYITDLIERGEEDQ